MSTKNGGWKLGFCECTKYPGYCLLITCCGWLGLAAVQSITLSRIESRNPSPVIGFAATYLCACFGAAWNRQAVRKHRNLDRESYWYDCAAYSSRMLCSMGIQELAEVTEGFSPEGPSGYFEIV